MAVDIRLPQFSGTEKEQLSQIRSYLYQLAGQLQWALKNVDTSSTVIVQSLPKSLAPSETAGVKESAATFASIKSLIIESAEIVEAYYGEISKKLTGVYVARSDFSDYTQETAQTIEENSTSTTQGFENVQTIMTENRSRLADVDEDLQVTKSAINNGIQGVQERVTGVNALLEDAKAQLNGSLDDLEAYVLGLNETVIGVTAYLKSGLIDYTDAGIPVYGLEIGQSVRDDVAGTEVFNKYARFTSEKLSFFDSNGYEVAYISDKKLLIKMAEVTVSLQIGKLIDLVMDNGDVVTKWLGG